ncbi:MAG: ferredoxin-NADP reductase/nitrite reductase/ring-hydroxylating ferredoxin subunit [Candidatus Nitrosomirales archaeon]|jgi:ferredoxin-NADP reductase/nitrite reductase/ring-hydroxylating ferredoxin subunit
MVGSQKVANKKDLKEGGLMRVEIDGKPVVLAMVKGKVYAMDAVCSHEGGPLEDGSLNGYELKCPWHYAIFDVRNAKVSDQTVWATDLRSYPVNVDETSGDITISLDPQAQETTQEKNDDRSNVNTKHQDLYYSLTLGGKQHLQGTDIATFRFTKEGYPEYKAGQFAFFPLDSVNNDSKGPVRHFTIASSPTEDVLIISTRIRNSEYKQRLASLQTGAKVKVSKPQGNFVLHNDHSKPAVFLSGGIGVTPFRSMMKYATDKKLPIKITMFDSNRNQQNILYKDEFDSWATENGNLKVVYTVSDEATENWSGENGRIDKSMLERHLTREQIDSAIFYICGPPGMLKAVIDLLKNDLRVPDDRIKIEEFTGY